MISICCVSFASLDVVGDELNECAMVSWSVAAFCMLCLSAISMSESGLCVFCKLCPVCFLVVGECPSVLL